MGNILKREKQEAIIKCLVDGTSIRATERIVDVHRDSIMRYMVRVGEGCAKLMDEEMRGLDCKRIQVDEIWSFVQKKQGHLTSEDDVTRMGDFYIFVAIDEATKLIPSFLIGKRNIASTQEFMKDLASRLENRIQLSADAWGPYIDAAWYAFNGDLDFGQVVKSYEAEPIGPGRYAPPRVSAIDRKTIHGNHDQKAYFSTSYIERSNLTMRTHMKRLTRLSLCFSKKLENLQAATALHFAHYNLCRIHGTIKTTPAVAAGVVYQPWTVSDLLDAVQC